MARKTVSLSSSSVGVTRSINKSAVIRSAAGHDDHGHDHHPHPVRFTFNNFLLHFFRSLASQHILPHFLPFSLPQMWSSLPFSKVTTGIICGFVLFGGVGTVTIAVVHQVSTIQIISRATSSSFGDDFFFDDMSVNDIFFLNALFSVPSSKTEHQARILEVKHDNRPPLCLVHSCS